MKAYFIAILTLFTCIATVVRAQQMSELENRIDSLLNGKKATVGIAVWTDKGDMLRYNDHVHFPLLSVFKFHVALAVLDKMDKQSISLDSIDLYILIKLHLYGGLSEMKNVCLYAPVYQCVLTLYLHSNYF